MNERKNEKEQWVYMVVRSGNDCDEGEVIGVFTNRGEAIYRAIKYAGHRINPYRVVKVELNKEVEISFEDGERIGCVG